jgi:DNA-binding IclR family transcriptional regulator
MPKQPTTEKTSALDGKNDAAESTEDAAAGASYLVPGLERGLRILAEFSAREPILGAPELSKRIGIPRTTTFRLLQTLESLGFLERVNDDRNFRLGVAVLRLGFEYLSSLELTDFAAPILERLRDATGLNAHLLIRDQRDVVFVAKAQSHDAMFSSVRVHVGTRFPAHATTHGHVLMSDLGSPQLRMLYPEKRLEQFTDRTPGTVSELEERVRVCASQGYGSSEGAFERGISVVTAPVRERSGSIVAAVTVTVPRSEFGTAREKDDLVTAVCGAAIELSMRMGYRPYGGDPTAQLAASRTEKAE